MWLQEVNNKGTSYYISFKNFNKLFKCAMIYSNVKFQCVLINKYVNFSYSNYFYSFIGHSLLCREDTFAMNII